MMIRVFEGFAGYGGWSFGIDLTGQEYEIVGYSEVDKYAIQCYEQNHKAWDEFNRSINYGDITQIDLLEIPDFDIGCFSPPCQAFSVAGKGQGANDEKGRGRLFEDSINLVKVKQPKVAIFENVKGLTNKKHQDYFNYILGLMEDAGYNVYWKVLNTKEQGIPQNRERVFIVCFRKDIDSSSFKFPEKEELKIFLKDILEEEVDEKYYLNENYFDDSPLDGYIKATKTKRTFEGGLVVPNATKKGWTIAYPYDGVKLEHPKSNRGRVGIKISNCMASSSENGVVMPDLRIRRFTEKEMFRLMGFTKDQIDLEGFSYSRLKKIAGNGVSINVIKKLMDEVFKIIK